MVTLLPHTKPVTNLDFSKALADIRLSRSKLKLPELCYGAVSLEKDRLAISVAGEYFESKLDLSDTPHFENVFSWIDTFHAKKQYKIVALYLDFKNELSKQHKDTLLTKLWLTHDIVPLQTLNAAGVEFEKSKKTAQSSSILNNSQSHTKVSLLDLAAQVSALFDKNGIVQLEIADQNEVIPSFLTNSEAYVQSHDTDETTNPLTSQTHWHTLQSLAKTAKNQKQNIVFVSATPRGGGVALMRHALIRLYRLLGVDAHWHVLTEHADVFQITKGKFHNVLQAVSDPLVKLNSQDKELYEHWSQENAQLLSPALKKATTIIIDDPQPAGLIPFIKKHVPKARVLYRSHIQIEAHLLEDKTTPQAETWRYLWQYIQHADTFIAHPVPSFVPSIVPKSKLVSFPPTTDHLDGLNKPLSSQQIAFYLDSFNQILLQSYQTPLDTTRPYLIQIARFDPSKGIPDVVESFRLARKKLAENPDVVMPQLVLVGHGSVDDPDGMPLLHLTNHMLSLPLYRDLAHDVKVARIHHSDQLLNALLRQSHIALQLSHKEGFEIKVSEALLKGKPVISYKAGGIPLQIEHEKNGFVIEKVGNTKAVAEKIVELFTNAQLYRKMSQQASELARRDVLTVPNAIRWLQLAVGEEVKV